MLSIVEGRVLGCLIEKERTVPDQYPLTMNVLIGACNQSTAREPVMHVGESDVQGALTSMKAEGFARVVHPSHGRSVTRYRHIADERLALDRPGSSILAILLLRGPQTAGELHARAMRLHEFASNTDVESCLTDLTDHGHVERLERQPGQKEQRWKQLLAEEADFHPVQASTGANAALAQRVVELEDRVARLEAALADLL
jgi:uncharacterized protein YceH (UPF0502 family)